MDEAHEFSDYSMAVKMRGKPQKPWAWEIYRAGTDRPVEASKAFFATMTEAIRGGKAALERWRVKQAALRKNLARRPAEHPRLDVLK